MTRFSAARALAAWRVLALLLITFALGCVAVEIAPSLRSDGGKPPEIDFVVFWSAGRLALAGHAAAAYHAAAIAPLQQAAVDMAPPEVFPFFYPPPLLVLCAALAVLPYLWAFAAFAAVQLAVLVVPLRRLLPPPWPLSSLVLAPALLINLAVGQTGALVAGGFAWAAVLIGRWPFCAGMVLAVATLKPHLAVLAPWGLLVGRHWRALAGFISGVLALAALSLAFGAAPWMEFVAAIGKAGQFQQHTTLVWEKMASVFSAVWFLGASPGAAYVVQAVVAALAVLAVGYVGLRARSADWVIAAAAAATPLISPHVFDYDLAVTLPAIAVLVRHVVSGGRWLAYEKAATLAMFAVPVLARPAAMGAHIGLAPVCVAALVAVIVRRAIIENGAVDARVA